MLRSALRRGLSSLASTPHNAGTSICKDKIIITAALNGVFTDPAKFDIPVSYAEMAEAAREVYEAGASCVHIHFRDQRPGHGHLPTWEPDVAAKHAEAIRAAAPELLINFTTGTIGDDGSVASGGPLGPCGGPISCMDAPGAAPEMAALNSGSLNYLKIKRNGEWAWPPNTFENSVQKITEMVSAMYARGVVPECESFDTGIVRSLAMYETAGILKPLKYTVSLVMGVASGMPCDPAWVKLLAQELPPNAAAWQVIAIGRNDVVWPTLRECARLGGNVRTGLEDTFYLRDGTRATSNAQLITELVGICAEEGRTPATCAETRDILGHPTFIPQE